MASQAIASQENRGSALIVCKPATFNQNCLVDNNSKCIANRNKLLLMQTFKDFKL